MKTYVLMLSKAFPSTHPRKGEPTRFFDKFLAGQALSREGWLVDPKLHTIRANFPLWAKRIAEVQRGEAMISIRAWMGAPYRSKQEEVARLTKDDGVGIQKLELELADKLFGIYHPRIDEGKGGASLAQLANNDGLSLDDWKDWFRHYDHTKPLAIIHFTKFRY
jgi:hypothetical protein